MQKWHRLSIELPKEKIEEFCSKWKVREFALFGSVLREDFRPDSDVDVLIAYREGAKHTLFDVIRMTEEFEEIFGQKLTL